MSVLTV